MLIDAHRLSFGRNEHPVKIDSYPSYLFDILTKPFFILQYIVCIAFIVERLQLFAILTLALSFVTTTINYVIAYISFLKIK